MQLYSLAEHSELKRKQLFPVLIDSSRDQRIRRTRRRRRHQPRAVPRRLKTSTNTPRCIAHELAHLSQRHFARQIEMQQQSTLPYLAAMLASIVIAATVGWRSRHGGDLDDAGGGAGESAAFFARPRTRSRSCRHQHAGQSRPRSHRDGAHVRTDAACVSLQPASARVPADAPGDRNPDLRRAQPGRRLSKTRRTSPPKNSS